MKLKETERQGDSSAITTQLQAAGGLANWSSPNFKNAMTQLSQRYATDLYVHQDGEDTSKPVAATIPDMIGDAANFSSTVTTQQSVSYMVETMDYHTVPLPPGRNPIDVHNQESVLNQLDLNDKASLISGYINQVYQAATTCFDDYHSCQLPTTGSPIAGMPIPTVNFPFLKPGATPPPGEAGMTQVASRITVTYPPKCAGRICIAPFPGISPISFTTNSLIKGDYTYFITVIEVVLVGGVPRKEYKRYDIIRTTITEQSNGYLVEFFKVNNSYDVVITIDNVPFATSPKNDPTTYWRQLIPNGQPSFRVLWLDNVVLRNMSGFPNQYSAGLRTSHRRNDMAIKGKKKHHTER